MRAKEHFGRNFGKSPIKTGAFGWFVPMFRGEEMSFIYLKRKLSIASIASMDVY
jgi:hypothetical protein